MIVLKDRFKSTISDEEIKRYKEQSSRSTTKSERIFSDKTTSQVISDGIQLAKKNNRKIACSEKTIEL